MWATFDTAPLQMQVNADPVYPWLDLGFGLAGTAGIPVLAGTGPLVAGTPGAISLVGALPSAPALLFVSTSNSPTPFKGGLLVPVPVQLALPVAPGSPGGDIVTWAAWPPGLGGLIPTFQCAIQDPVAVKGVALSNAMEALVP